MKRYYTFRFAVLAPTDVECVSHTCKEFVKLWAMPSPMAIGIRRVNYLDEIASENVYYKKDYGGREANGGDEDGCENWQRHDKIPNIECTLHESHIDPDASGIQAPKSNSTDKHCGFFRSFAFRRWTEMYQPKRHWLPKCQIKTNQIGTRTQVTHMKPIFATCVGGDTWINQKQYPYRNWLIASATY